MGQSVLWYNYGMYNTIHGPLKECPRMPLFHPNASHTYSSGIPTPDLSFYCTRLWSELSIFDHDMIL